MASLCINKIGGLGHVPLALTHDLSREVFSFTSLLPEHTHKKNTFSISPIFRSTIQSINPVHEFSPSIQPINPVHHSSQKQPNKIRGINVMGYLLPLR